ncbi:hypothetical protein KI387_042204, partial [Taxus chinensis]
MDLLVLALASSKLASVQAGLKEALCGSASKKGRKSKQELALLEVDVDKQSVLNFAKAMSGK